MAKRLGFMTGTVYDEDTDVTQIHECCVLLNNLDTPNIKELKENYHCRCILCGDYYDCCERNGVTA